MALLLEEDYEYLSSIGLDIAEDEAQRFLIFQNFPLPKGMYRSEAGDDVDSARILVVIPPNYNASGNDMFWTEPALRMVDGTTIPQVGGTDTRNFQGSVFERWSRHWNKTGWKPKQDNVRTIIDRVTWALANPTAKRA